MIVRQFSQYFAIVCLLCVFTCSSLWAQKKKAANFPEGIITYKIEASGNELGAAEQFLNTTNIQLFIKDKSSCLDIAMMNGFVRLQLVYNAKEEKTFMLMDMPFAQESKIAIHLDKESLAGILPQDQLDNLNQEADPEALKKAVKKVKGSKRIAKYNCKKAQIELPDEAKDVVLEFYVTDKIRTNNFTQFVDALKGFPLGMDIKIESTQIAFYATEVEQKSILDSRFSIPSEYTVKSFEEFKGLFEDKIDEKVIGL